MFGLILAPLIQKLAGAGLNKLAKIVASKGKEFVEEKTGINLSEPEKITQESMILLKGFEDKDADRWLEDMEDARNMYREADHKTADDLASGIMKYNLPVILALVITNIIAVMNLRDDGELIAIISNFIGIAIGQLFNERQAVVNFFFGSSKGSKDKSQRLSSKK